MSKPNAHGLGAAILAGGMVVFALCAHRNELRWVAVGGAAVAVAGLAIGIARAPSVIDLLGLRWPMRRKALLLPIALGIGVAWAVYFRHHTAETLVPHSLGSFVLLAMAIGAGEEIAYRGFVQSSVGRVGPGLACVIAAAAHTAYKCSLMAFPAGDVRADMLVLAVGTFGVGVALGVLREAGGNILPAVLAHVTFDLVAYGDLTEPLWWV